VDLQRLTSRYGDLVALDDLSFTVVDGQMFGFVGPNGAGKTTAMRIVLGVLEARPGRGPLAGPAGRRRDPPPLRLHARGPRPNVFSAVRLLAGLPPACRRRGHRRSGRRPARRLRPEVTAPER
jgi:energy-coupling factor transporter ATP-binding protein EcfA2